MIDTTVTRIMVHCAGQILMHSRFLPDEGLLSQSLRPCIQVFMPCYALCGGIQILPWPWLMMNGLGACKMSGVKLSQVPALLADMSNLRPMKLANISWHCFQHDRCLTCWCTMHWPLQLTSCSPELLNLPDLLQSCRIC